MTIIRGRLELGPPTGAGELYISSREDRDQHNLIDVLRPLLGKPVQVIHRTGQKSVWYVIEGDLEA